MDNQMSEFMPELGMQHEIDRLNRILETSRLAYAKKTKKIKSLKEQLKECYILINKIKNQDYRGNRCGCSQMAYNFVTKKEDE